MSNGIAERQNEESNITRLAAQRQLYRDVDIIELLNVVLTVVIPIILTTLQDIMGWGKTLACIIALVMLVLQFVLENYQKEKKKLAATIQQEFDISVYSIEWDDKLFGLRKDHSSKIATYSKKIITNQKEKESLKNWYRPEVDKLPLVDGIIACQRENFSWDAGLRKRYRNILIVGITVLICIQVCMGIVTNESIQELLLRVFVISPALKWMLKTIVGLFGDLKRMESVERAVYSREKKSLEDLAFTQKDIFENRKVITKIPDWFYNRFKDNDEDRERRAIDIQINEKH